MYQSKGNFFGFGVETFSPLKCKKVQQNNIMHSSIAANCGSAKLKIFSFTKKTLELKLDLVCLSFHSQ